MLYGTVDNADNVPILLDNLECSGNERSLVDPSCQVSSMNRFIHDCDHSEDAGVQCGGQNSVSVISTAC